MNNDVIPQSEVKLVLSPESVPVQRAWSRYVVQWLNSLSVQLNGTLVVLVFLIMAAVALNLQAIETFSNSQQMLNITSLQRSNSYLVASLARRVFAAEAVIQRRSMVTLLQSTMQNIQLLQSDLRSTFQRFQSNSIEKGQLSTVIDDLSLEWESYAHLVNDFLAMDDPMAQEELLAQIDNRSVSIFNTADRLVNSVDVLVQQERDLIQRLMLLFIAMAAVVFLVTLGLVQRILSPIHDLSVTAQQFSERNFAARAHVGGLTELSRVARVFNAMATQLEALIGGLLERLQLQVEMAEKARADAEQANNVKSSFLASMSHELRTPLNAIINFTKFVGQGDLGPVNEQQKDILGEVVDSAKHLLNLINDVLDMSKIESGSLKLLVEDGVQLNEIFDSLAATTRSLLLGKSVVLTLAVPPDLPTIRGDRQRILQVLLNIVSNACKFTERGEITIAAGAGSDTITIFIRDTGPGISPEQQAVVFQPFQQTSSGLRQGSGTGLGMSISKNLVEAHHGKIWLESAVDKGTTFYITLPIASEQLTPIAAFVR